MLARAETEPRPEISFIQKGKQTLLPVVDRAWRLAISVGLIGTPTAITSLAFENFSGNTTIVRAADPNCTIKSLTILGFRFVDNPIEANRKGLIDPKDFVIGSSPEMGEAVLNMQEDIKNPKSTRTEVDRANMIAKDDYAEITFTNLKVKSNVTKGQTGKAAARILFSFADDKVKPAGDPTLPVEKALDVECGERGLGWGGRVSREGALDTEVKNAKGLNMVGTRVDAISELKFGKGIKLGVAPTGDNPAANLQALKANLETVKKDLADVRAKEKAQSQPTATPTKVPTINPSSTPTPTPIPGKGQNIEPNNQPKDAFVWARESIDLNTAGPVAGALVVIGSGIVAAWRKFRS